MPAHARPQLAIRVDRRPRTAATLDPAKTMPLHPIHVPALHAQFCPHCADAVTRLADVPRRSVPGRFATEALALLARHHQPNSGFLWRLLDKPSAGSPQPRPGGFPGADPESLKTNPKPPPAR